MKCPGCKAPLVVLEIERIEIDHCLECGGVWLDGDELELLLASAANKETLLSGLERIAKEDEKAISCPICSKKLEKVRYHAASDITLDKCARGDGLWFDAGELLGVLRAGDFLPEDPVYRLLNDVFGKNARE